jgi:predicted unusual protein kinase regulating ubiquinone biosynthesis (AarF/ABC1/UbiB family)
MIVQPQLILLQKTLLAVEGLSRELYPELDLWETAYPYIKKSVRAKFGLKSELKKILLSVPMLLENMNQDWERHPQRDNIRDNHLFLVLKTFIALSALCNSSLYLLNSYSSPLGYGIIMMGHFVFFLIFHYQYIKQR